MKKTFLISLTFIIILIQPFRIVSQSNNQRIIKWNKVGQIETVNKNENYIVVYDIANPENTRVQFIDNGDDSYTLELVSYNDLHKFNSPFEDKYQNLLDSIKSLKNSNDSILLSLSNKNFEKPNNNKNFIDTVIINEKSNYANQYKASGKTRNELKKEILNREKKIDSVRNIIINNIEEYRLNSDKIKIIKDKINYLRSNNGTEQEIKEIQDELEALLDRNFTLQQYNQMLNLDRDALIEENRIKSIELDFQSKLSNAFIAIALIILILLIIIYISYRNKKKDNKIIKEANEQSESLLHNILPISIASRLKEGEIIADEFEDASVIFIDIVGFTSLSSDTSPKRLVKVLNDIFTRFDKFAVKHNIEKIKTIGDSYMAASGIPEANDNHDLNIANMAIEIVKEMKNYKTDDGATINFRIGLNSGPIVAGVIGEQKFIYDLWGDTVNVAARMESNGEVNKIQCNDTFKNKLLSKSNSFKFKERGVIDIKGKGKMNTWFLNS
ncbi:adenylate/guanylate cyclase domain-containing protein [Candidatus Kapabacteria bacterium]|nr:adenylate/guanylate cyclase domain-containing protein [Candidatus Kapabacteria bacterium]